jgi:uncharacterized protein
MDIRTDQAIVHIQKIARSHFEDAKGSHAWDHTLRVVDLCRRIGPLEGADMVVLLSSAYLHDIGRTAQDRSNGSICHAVQGARMAQDVLAPLALPPACKENIIHCVRAHRFRDGHAPQSIEAKVLFDADKLDAIGAIGVARAYLFAGELGACLHNPGISAVDAVPYSSNDTGYREYMVKLAFIKDRMLTEAGRVLAQGRHQFMVTFFERFLAEYEGKC